MAFNTFRVVQLSPQSNFRTFYDPQKIPKPICSQSSFPPSAPDNQ